MFAKPVPGRTTAAAEGEVVVLLIGMRINHFWAVHQWLPVMLSMFRMLGELARDRSRGLLGHVLLTASPRSYHVVQYWESKEKLYAYAAAADALHHRVWGIVNRKERAGKLHRHVGLWHEAYVVPEGSYESIYFDMPPAGLAAATGTLPVESRGRRAADRFAHRSSGARGKADRQGSRGESGEGAPRR
ncbi:DUF4188 domain-containing protein [Streptomyces sp. RY43-2]|uniref:DUF4188 domain-containing protein n=1 Tax=Streptomyces macrolidinus TaxID=2952607 RepID=A0ABT0ZGX6_9ACTN|nr:DUF4188 domain-containing protein [Streptomyces macrolidinus]MCN9242842.1 DUF4188 domain-containing protein [Streptomyces macrolidinus]